MKMILIVMVILFLFNKKLGFATFKCPDCHELYYVSCTCKSRACSSCGYKYKIKIVDNIMNKVYDGFHFIYKEDEK